MINRRQMVLGGTSAFVGLKALSLDFFTSIASAAGNAAPDILATDEDFWKLIARAYRLDGQYTVLNGGGNNPHPTSVVSALNRFDQLSSTQPRPHNYIFLNRKDTHRKRLAKLMNCAEEEMAITRNTTEGLNIVCFGLDLKEGDELLTCQFDDRYAGPIFEQLSNRLGIKITTLELPIPPDPAAVVEQFRQAMTPRTKLIAVSHIVDAWGFVLPIKELSDLAHENGAQLLADGALSFGAVPVDVKALGCDYYATSLHKWLNAPLGTGALYVRQDRIEDLWPLYGNRTETNDIRKFEQIGTRSGPTIAAIGQALDFYEQIGPARKVARLRYLLQLVIDGLADTPGVTVITEPNPALRSGLARIAVEGFTGRELTRTLRDNYQLYTFGNFPGPFDGVYISPNVFNLKPDMEKFIAAIKDISANT